MMQKKSSENSCFSLTNYTAVDEIFFHTDNRVVYGKKITYILFSRILIWKVDLPTPTDPFLHANETFFSSKYQWKKLLFIIYSADGNYEVTIMTKAILHYSGKVTWNPPAIYKSGCEIDVEYFPFDEQNCFMKFGSWTYDGYMVIPCFATG